jgi:hypothetical protein
MHVTVSIGVKAGHQAEVVDPGDIRADRTRIIDQVVVIPALDESAIQKGLGVPHGASDDAGW